MLDVVDTALRLDAAHVPELAWDTARAAAATGLSVTWLEQLRLRGGGPPYVKVGRRVLYRPQDIAAWLQQNLRRSASQ